MTGAKLKEKMKLLDMSQAEIARRLGITTPTITSWFKYQSVSTKILEDLCDVCNVTLDFFYKDTKYISHKESSAEINKEGNFAALFEKILKERDDYKDQLYILKNQLSDMQRGKTIPEIAKKEVV